MQKYIRLNIAPLFHLLFASLLILPRAQATSVEDLNQIQDKAASFLEFINRADLQIEYLRAAQSYFGGQDAFPQKSFEAILGHLKAMAELDPTIADRAWRKTPLGPTFSVRFNSGTRIALDAEKWFNFFTTSKLRIREKSGRWRDWWLSGDLTERFVRAVYQAQSTIKSQLRERSYTKGRFEKLIGQHEELIAALLLYQLELEDNKEGLQSQSWESVSFVTQKLATQKDLFWQGVFKETPELSKYWKYMEPDLIRTSRTPEKFCDFFKGDVPRVVTFRAVRPFLALFRGLPVKECTAGDCTLLERLTARRFAIPLLNDAWVQFVEENSKGSGHIQSLPLSNPRIGGVLSVDLMAGKLREIVRTSPGDSHFEEVSVFDLWLREMQLHLPPGVLGIAMSESMNANNEKMPEFVRGRKTYLLGRNLGPAAGFFPIDGDMAYKISLLGWRLEKEHHYGNCLTFDGCDEKAGDLRLLNPELLESVPISDRRLNELWMSPGVDQSQVLSLSSRAFQVELAKRDSSGFRNALMRAKIGSTEAEAYVKYLTDGESPGETSLNLLRKLRLRYVSRGLGTLAKRSGQEVTLPLAIRSTPKDVLADFNDLASDDQLFALQHHVRQLNKAGLLGDWSAAISALKEHKAVFSKLAFEQFGVALCPILEKYRFESRKFSRLRSFFGSIDTDIALIKAVTLKTDDPQVYVEVLKPNVKKPHDAYKRALNDLVLTLTPRFAKLNPNAKQIKSWLLRTNYVSEGIGVRKKLLEREKLTPDQVMAIFANEYGQDNGSDPYNKAVNNFFQQNWKQAFRQLESLDDFILAIELCPYVNECVEMRAEALKLVRTPLQFFNLYRPRLSSPSDVYKTSLKKAMAEQVDFFLSLKPSVLWARTYQTVVGDEKIKQKISAYLKETNQITVRSNLAWSTLSIPVSACAKLLMSH